jgi:pyrroloquinoline quinone biosynthesis protein B
MRIIILLILILSSCFAYEEGAPSSPYIMILGTVQDGGYPQAGCKKSCCKKAFENKEQSKKISSLAIIDPISKEQWIIDATPDFRIQLHELQKQTNINNLSGIFLTHAHIGHYLGLAQLGREVMGNKKTNVFCLKRMLDFLSDNGPWDQLVKLNNIILQEIYDEQKILLNQRISITPFLVPHRDEYSETVGYKIATKNKKLIYIPDIDKWDRWDKDIVNLIKNVDYAFLDGTFYKEGELNRDMSMIPHPFVKESMGLFNQLSNDNKKKIFFTHLNHTNPLLIKGSKEQVEVLNNGYNFATDRLIIEL